VQANSTDGTASADATSDTTYGLGSPNPTSATNVVIDAASIAATAAITFSALSANWTQGMAFGGSATLHPAYSAYRTNMPTGASATQVTGTVAAVNGYAWAVINEAAIYERPQLDRHAAYRM
jgi:hypothetical protein